MNPFTHKSQDVETYCMNWAKMYPKPYDKRKTSPYTKTRIILMNGTEYESVWFLHQFARHCEVDEIKQAILQRKTDLRCPLCGEPLITRIARMYDLEDNLVLLCPNCHSLTSTYKNTACHEGRKDRSKYYKHIA